MIVRRTLILTICLLLSCFSLSCAGSAGNSGGNGGSGSGSGSSSGSDFGLSTEPRIELDINGQAYSEGDLLPTIYFSKGQIDVGSTIQETIVIKNTAIQGSDNLTVSVVQLNYTPPPGAADTGDAIRLVSIKKGGEAQAISENGLSAAISISPVGDGGTSLEVVVEYKRYDDSLPRNASLQVKSNTLSDNSQNLMINFETTEGKPVANVQPSLVDYGQVPAGEKKAKSINVSNTGTDVLSISKVLFQGHPDYAFIFQDKDGVSSGEWAPGDEIQFNPPVTVAPGDIVSFVVTFSPQVPDPAEGKVVFYTNDPTKTTGILVQLKANTDGPAIQVNPKKVQFGGKLVSQKASLPVEIRSVGNAPLEVYNVTMTDGSNTNFALEYNTLPGFEDNSAPSQSNPLVLQVNSQGVFNVTYVPSIENPVGDDGFPILDNGTILIESNAFDAKLEIEVSGLGVTKECPTSVVVVQEGEQVIPQTNLHLFGDQSFAPAGAVAEWKWTVDQPAGSASVFIPSDEFPNPTFEVNAAGEYLFSLDVWDGNGVKSCIPFKQKVLVIPDEAIHVELLWHTPNDPDETDQGPEAGSDVDLHFVHDKYAASGPDLDKDGLPDPWFDQPFDCFWFNAHPNWGSFDPSIDDDPGLDRDDTDGAGPENLNLNIPEDTTYRVGVHYWSDHEYGTSFITLRIYIYSNLVWEQEQVALVNHDMWDAATIDWPSGNVSEIKAGDGSYKITPGYQNPFFFQP
ncbi:MAG TPA: choice-of-anchor D domain-containing protein [Myxococcales bacterium]|nr:choice-of-anchor D domain-containing protein [Myxococcales bacterium]HIN86971.1 choice-of-anchor D domain-containing protein [Myxococcales bacterium]